MGVHKNRRFWTHCRMGRSHAAHRWWGDEGVRYTSICPDCDESYWEHLDPRETCPRCFSRMVTTETYRMSDIEMLMRARELLLSMARANVPSQDDERAAVSLAGEIERRIDEIAREMVDGRE